MHTDAHGAPRNPDELLTTRQAAAEFNMSDGTLENWRTQGKGPPFVYVGIMVRYRRRDLEAFITKVKP